ncbi:MAG: class I SAM-dependent methyltransferase [Spirochaetes bacterium]|nr:class I SAM-dependent methyltransferase [Spirochaetota bacterium]
MKKIKECFLCNHTRYQSLYRIRDRHYSVKGTYSLVKCTNCSLVFLNPMPDEKELGRLYPQGSYYSYQDFLNKKKSFKYKLEHFFIRFDTKDPEFFSKGRLLDIGCGSGEYLYEMKKKGWRSYGVEISKKAAECGKNQAKLNIFCGTLLKAKFKKDFFDFIRSNHSFEHVVNPNQILKEIARIIKPNGRVLIGVPNISGLALKIFGKYWYYLGVPFHPFSYSKNTLKRMMEKHGLIAEKINYNSNYHGLLGSLQIFLNRKKNKTSHEGWFINNHILKVLFHWLAKVLDLFRIGDCIEIIASKKLIV